jgi:hypothetical protein
MKMKAKKDKPEDNPIQVIYHKKPVNLIQAEKVMSFLSEVKHIKAHWNGKKKPHLTVNKGYDLFVEAAIKFLS